MAHCDNGNDSTFIFSTLKKSTGSSGQYKVIEGCFSFSFLLELSGKVFDQKFKIF